MKILICTFSYPYIDGNVFDSRFVYSEAAGYSSNDAEVTVLTPHFPGSPELEHSRENIRIIRFPYFFPKSLQRARAPGKPLYNPGSILAVLQFPLLCLVFMIKIIQLAGKTDIIHAQWTLSALLALPAKWITGKPIVLTARGSDIRLLPRWLNRFIFRQVNAAIDCYGPTIWKDTIVATFPAHYIHLPLMVLDDSSTEMPEDMNAIVKNKEDAFIMLYTGRFHPIKVSETKLPLFDLIPALRALKENGLNFHLFYIGDGKNEVIERLNTLIAENNLRENISLLGAKTNVMSYMKHCNFGIGGIAFNSVSQEYTISKKPQLLIATKENTDSPWRDKENSVFCTPENVAELTEKIQWAINNPGKLEKIGLAASKDMKNYFVESDEGGKLYLDAFRKLAAR